jgi:hypothetical protein
MSSGMWRCVGLVRTDVSEERAADWKPAANNIPRSWIFLP